MVYSERDYDIANNVHQNFCKVAPNLGIVIGDPQWVEVKSNKPSDFNTAIQSDV
jgi:hypothetical protein